MPDQAMYAAPYFAGVAMAAYRPQSWSDRYAVVTMCLVLGSCAAGPIVIGEEFSFTFLAVLPVTAAVMVILLNRRWIDEVFGSAGLRYVGRESMVVYLSHWRGVIASSRLLTEFDITAETLRVVIATALTVGCSLVFLWLHRHIAMSRWLFEWPCPARRWDVGSRRDAQAAMRSRRR